MALLGNRSVLLKSPGRYFGGATVSDNRSNFGTPGSTRGRYFAGFPATNATPTGYRPPYSWIIAIKNGEMSTTNAIDGAASLSGDGNLGLPAFADLSGVGDIIFAALALVVSAVANLSGSGSLTAGVVGKLEAAAALAGAGNLAGAAGALASLLAGLSGAGGVAGTPKAFGALSANIKGYGDLTPEGIRDSVWSAVLANYPVSGSAGNTLALAGSGGVDYHALGLAVWNILNTEANTPGTMGASVQSGGGGGTSGLTLAQFLALK